MIPTRNPSCVWLVTELQFIVLSCIVNYQILNHMLYHDLEYERYNPLTPYFLQIVTPWSEHRTLHLTPRVVARAIDQLSILGTDQTGKFGIRNVGKPWSLKTKTSPSESSWAPLFPLDVEKEERLKKEWMSLNDGWIRYYRLYWLVGEVNDVHSEMVI